MKESFADKEEDFMKLKGLLTAAVLGLLFNTSLAAGNHGKFKNCVAYTEVDNVCATVPEFKFYYQKYKAEVIKEVGKGNWYFNLADEVQASKELMLQKLLLHEANKSHVEKTKWYKNYIPEIKEAEKEIKQWVKKQVKEGKIPLSKAKLVEKRLIEKTVNGYKVKAYLDMMLKDAIKVTREDLESFFSAHKGEYGLSPDPNNPNLKVVDKRQLVEAIREEKKQVAAEQFADYLFKKYKVKVNVELLKKLDKIVNAGQNFKKSK